MASLKDVLKTAHQRRMPYAIAAIGNAASLVMVARKLGLVATKKTEGTVFISVGSVRDIANLALMPSTGVEYATITHPKVGLLNVPTGDVIEVNGLSFWTTEQLVFSTAAGRSLIVNPSEDSGQRLKHLIEIAKRRHVGDAPFKAPMHNVRVLRVGDQIKVTATGACYTVVMT